MGYGTSQALAHPTKSVSQGAQKSCFETPVTIVKANGSSVHLLYNGHDFAE